MEGSINLEEENCLKNFVGCVNVSARHISTMTFTLWSYWIRTWGITPPLFAGISRRMSVITISTTPRVKWLDIAQRTDLSWAPRHIQRKINTRLNSMKRNLLIFLPLIAALAGCGRTNSTQPFDNLERVVSFPFERSLPATDGPNLP